jgi:PTS system mannose-specific IIB component/fructoselysine and glucoselysine-specific PTS system IIB component
VDVNVGGIHHAPGRRQALPYVYLSERETVALRALADSGANVSAQDLPAARSVDLDQLLEDGTAN